MVDSSDLRKSLAAFLAAVDPGLLRRVLSDLDEVTSRPGAAVVLASTLEAARAAVEAPEGSLVVSETVILVDEPLTVTGFAAGVEEARREATRLLPAGTAILGERVVPPQQETLGLEAPDPGTAESRALAILDASTPFGRPYVRSVRTVQVDKGSEGLLGFGRRPSRYEVTASTDTGVALAVRPPVVVGFEFGDVAEMVRRAVRAGRWQQAARVGTPAIGPLVESMTADDTPGAREAAAQALATIGRPAVAPLVAALGTECRCKAWILDALGRTGAAEALEPLVEALSEGEGSLRDAAARALGRLGDPRACAALERCIAEIEGRWSADEPLRALWRLQYVRAGDVSHLTALLRDRRHADLALGLLEELGDRRAAEAVIDLLFARGEEGSPVRCRFGALFGDYAGVLTDVAAGYTETCHTEGRDFEQLIVRSFDTGAMRRAVDQLCTIDTPVSSNILHKVAAKGDVEVVEQEGDLIAPSARTLSFQAMRETAARVLAKRGLPPYDPAAYTRERAWAWPRRSGRPKR